ncbi:uncharacterized protein BXZ73DRAFT_106415 [Epithele typhae]|uniref:uncharacterized protein n=1 Tax=Epithele typhae TaxID=378194 RepID=UPI002007E9A1|nr:uncharacterized protein BXZ73DRAFT_106415 [Epithele typhae]KAH9914906.1 hypothetical protein BXZ73DRAFT_106415 [Epithele typhae]
MNDPCKYATLFVNLMQLPSLRTLSYVFCTTGSEPDTPLDAITAATPTSPRSRSRSCALAERADLRAIANAWPALVELRVEIEDDDEEVESEDEAKPGLEVLAELARGCPDLRVLHLPRTVLALGALDAAGVGLAAHRALYDLCLGVVEGAVPKC